MERRHSFLGYDFWMLVAILISSGKCHPFNRKYIFPLKDLQIYSLPSYELKDVTEPTRAHMRVETIKKAGVLKN